MNGYVAGTSFDVTVTALDPYGNVDTGYAGTIILTSSDRGPQPSLYTFMASDNGMHTFPVSLFTAAIETVMVRDEANGFITGTSSISVQPGAANHLLITAPSTIDSGTPFDVIITVLDEYENTVMNYQGVVHFTTSDHDPGVVLPADYSFTTGDGGANGVHAFPHGVVLVTPGLQDISGFDTSTGISGVIGITVAPGQPPGGRASRPSDPSSSAVLSRSILFSPVNRLL